MTQNELVSGDGTPLQTKRVLAQVTTCTPGCRTVLLVAQPFRDDADATIAMREIIPALAIETRNVHLLVREADGRPEGQQDADLPMTVQQYLDAGWEYAGHDIDSGIVFISPLTNELAHSLDSIKKWELRRHSVWKLVACYWPPEDDQERFAPIWREMEEGALEDPETFPEFE